MLKIKSKIGLVVAIFVFFTGTTFAAGFSSNSASVETILRDIQKDGRKNTDFSVSSVFVSKESRDLDGRVIVNQEGDLFVETITSVERGRDYDFFYGPKKRIMNIFSGTQCQPDICVVREIASTDLNQDGLDDIIIELVSLTDSISWYKQNQAYLALGGGEFVIQ